MGTLCNCLGFKKHIFIPQIRLSGNDGTIINVGEPTSFFLESDGLPDRIQSEWVVEAGDNTTFTIKVFSDNTTLNHRVVKYILVPLYMTAGIKTTVIGDFYIFITEKK